MRLDRKQMSRRPDSQSPPQPVSPLFQSAFLLLLINRLTLCQQKQTESQSPSQRRSKTALTFPAGETNTHLVR